MPTYLDIIKGSINTEEVAVKKDGLWDKNLMRRESHYVLGDSLNDTEDDIRATGGITTVFSVLLGMKCKSVKPRETDTVIHPVTGTQVGLWEVDVEYSSDVDGDDEDPLAQTPTVEWDGDTEEFQLYNDPVTGDPVENPNGELYEITGPVTIPILTVTRYEQYPWDTSIMLNYANRTNSTTFYGAPQGVCHMLPMQVTEERIASNGQTQKVNKVVYRIRFLLVPDSTGLVPFTQKAKVPLKGFKVREAAGSDPKLNIAKSGQPELIALATNGTALPSGDPLEFEEFNRLVPVNLNDLNLGPFSS